jgi:hypothetical protein
MKPVRYGAAAIDGSTNDALSAGVPTGQHGIVVFSTACAP